MNDILLKCNLDNSWLFNMYNKFKDNWYLIFKIVISFYDFNYYNVVIYNYLVY